MIYRLLELTSFVIVANSIGLTLIWLSKLGWKWWLNRTVMRINIQAIQPEETVETEELDMNIAKQILKESE
tara:strand:+ start:924 stop:1136 length:213 start_codon:yes stop_codon:yes gene_type:complete